MTVFSEIITQDRRLVILRALEEDAGNTINESVIQHVLELFGHKVSRDQVRTDLAWLQEQGLIAIEDVVGYMVAKITGRGVDVATGKAIVPGVKRPRPKG